MSLRREKTASLVIDHVRGRRLLPAIPITISQYRANRVLFSDATTRSNPPSAARLPSYAINGVIAHAQSLTPLDRCSRISLFHTFKNTRS